MREFFEQCLKDLEPLTGIRQLAFWEMEAGKNETAAREKLETCIKGMLAAARNFTEISDEKKMRIIRRAMQEDNQYEALNARTITKWLQKYRETSGPAPAITEDEWGRSPAPPEVAEKYTNQLLASLSDFKLITGDFTQTMEQIKAEDKSRLEGKEIRHGINHPSAPPEVLEMAELRQRYARECTDLGTGKILEGKPAFNEWLKTQI